MGKGKVVHIDQATKIRIEKLASYGLTLDQISKIEGISEKTLQRKCSEEFHRGKCKGMGAVAQSLYKMATSGENTAATTFYMKCQLRWREKDWDRDAESNNQNVFKEELPKKLSTDPIEAAKTYQKIMGENK